MDCRRDLIGFLTDRLTEDLARVWVRDAAFTDRQRRRRPGVAAQVAVLDDLLDALGRDSSRRLTSCGWCSSA